MNMTTKNWMAKTATIATIIIISIFTILSIYWKIDFLHWIVITFGGAITIWWLTIFILDGIETLLNFIKTGRI